MVEEWTTVQDRTTLKTLLTIIILAISIISIATLTLSASWAPLIQTNQPTYTTTYTSITSQKAYDFVYNNSHPIVIVDTRSCDCDYKQGHIPGAIWQINPTPFYNSTNDLIIYCQDGQSSTTFCEKLLGHTYGAIYHLEGGLDAWERTGYRTTKL